jgi:hypothetical protein
MESQPTSLFPLNGKEHDIKKEISGRNKRCRDRSLFRNDKPKEQASLDPESAFSRKHDLPPFPEEKDYKSMYKKAKKDLFFLHLDYDTVLDGYCSVCKKKDELNEELEKLKEKIKALSASISIRLN